MKKFFVTTQGFLSKKWQLQPKANIIIVANMKVLRGQQCIVNQNKSAPKIHKQDFTVIYQVGIIFRICRHGVYA